MEIKLENGRYVPSGYLGLERITGTDELLQRIIMRLKARRGGFFPLPDYGSRLYTLHTVKPSMRESAARQFIQEALSDEAGLSLDSVEIRYLSPEDIVVSAAFTYQGETRLFADTRI